MTMLNMTLVAEALKDFYLPGLRYQLNEKASPFLAQLEQDSEAVVGKEIVMAMRYGRQGGIGNRADDGDLPTPNSRKTKQAKWETKNIFARIQLSDKVIKASRTSEGAFVNLLEQELEDAQNDAKDNLARQVMGDGTGALATITAVDGTTLTVGEAATVFFAEGQLVDIYTGATKDTTAAEVIAVDEAAGTITVSSATGAAADDVIYISGSKGLELTGVKAVFESASLYGITRADFPFLKSTQKAISGEISEVAIQKAIDDAERKSGAVINFLLSSYGVRRAYQNLLTAQKSLVNTLELKGGHKVLSYNDIPFSSDKYAPAGVLRAMDLNDWKMYQMDDWNWLDADGAMLSRVSGKAAYEATLVKYADLGCQKPRGQVQMTAITEH